MAPVNRDRAQLLLVGALVIAVGLVALAIVLNSGIYTHNLASRADPIASEAVGNAAVVRDSVEGLVEFAVRHHPDDFTTQETTVTEGVSNVSDLVARESARRAVLTNATVTATVKGTTVYQDSDREFSDASSPAASNWTVATDTYGVRDFRMDVRRGDLNDQSGIPFGQFSRHTFNVTFEPVSGDAWNVSVYQEVGSPDVTVVTVTNTSSGRSFGPCTDDDDTDDWTEIDLTGATVAGEHCPALERIGNLSEPFDVGFAKADETYGTYSLVANTTTNWPWTAGSPGPSRRETLYAVWVDVRFQSHRVDYRTNVTAAPGEPDG